ERDAKGKALIAETEERVSKEKALAAETKALAVEKQARQTLLTALRATTDEIVENQMARNVQLTEENKAFLGKLITRFEELAAVTADDIESQSIRIEGLTRIGLMRNTLGDLPAAEEAYTKALVLGKQLAREFPARPDL